MAVNMSPELETLDQLLTGPLPLAIIRRVFPDSDAFTRGVLGLLTSGDVRLLENESQNEVPGWRWRELFIDGNVIQMLGNFELHITDQDAGRVA